MEWKAEYTKNASDDLKNLDKTQQMQVIKAIKKHLKTPCQKQKADMESLREITFQVSYPVI
ncbi:hypothetical protein [Sedimentibacter sp.]|uniref:type II toxin-antitoxin system RelE family toxin n=1 Tax=Sedimentibacter sp. TaxID=1960295 RepID=UPI0028A2002D|nr:hypothetical protein [Sedimentibacter sp.]